MVFKNIFQTDINETQNRNLSDESSSALSPPNKQDLNHHTNQQHDSDSSHGSDTRESRTKCKQIKKEADMEDALLNRDITTGSLTKEELKSIIEEKRRKNVEASIRFRLKKRNKVNDLMQKIQIENDRIATFKKQLHKLEIENTCLRKMLVGNWNPQTDNEFLADEDILNSSVSGDMTNWEILRNLKHGKSS